MNLLDGLGVAGYLMTLPCQVLFLGMIGKLPILPDEAGIPAAIFFIVGFVLFGVWIEAHRGDGV